MITNDTWIEEDGFGMIGSNIIRRYTLTNKSKASVCLISFGAGIQSIRVPNKKGILGDVVLGWDNINGYKENRYIGRTIGRMTKVMLDRIITIPSKKHSVSKNYENNRHILNDRFDNVNWDCFMTDKSVIMSHLSLHRTEGYPGNMLTQIKYTWCDDNELFINIRATSTHSTVVNISNYCLFNLAGYGVGCSELNRHVVTVNSNNFLSINANELPTVRSVNGTIFDIRKPTILSSRMLREVPGGGFDHIFCINSPSTWCYRFHARVLHPESGRFVEIHSNQPGIYFSTANHFPSSTVDHFPYSNHWGGYVNNSSKNELNNSMKDGTLNVWGKGGFSYKKHCGFLLSPQNYLNFLNMPHFPSCILHPGNVYQHNMSFKFGVKI